MGTGKGNNKRVKNTQVGVDVGIGGAAVSILEDLNDLEKQWIIVDMEQWNDFLIKNNLKYKSYAEHYLGGKKNKAPYNDMEISYIMTEVARDIIDNNIFNDEDRMGEYKNDNGNSLTPNQQRALSNINSGEIQISVVKSPKGFTKNLYTAKLMYGEKIASTHDFQISVHKDTDIINNCMSSDSFFIEAINRLLYIAF